jgi:hypothetical protein
MFSSLDRAIVHPMPLLGFPRRLSMDEEGGMMRAAFMTGQSSVWVG